MLHLNRFGLREHYRGVSAILLRNGPASMLFFGLRDLVRNVISVGDSASARVLGGFVCGAVLGAVLSTMLSPINGANTPAGVARLGSRDLVNELNSSD